MEVTVRVIHRFRNYRTAGTDGVTDELVKYGDDQLQQAGHEVMLMVWDKESLTIDH